MRGLAFFGGTFDPVHRGHLAIAHAALQALPVTALRFVPARAPWQKRAVTNAYARVTMLRLAIQYEPRFGVETCELLRSGPTYTIDTLRALRARLPEGMPLIWVMGGDQWRTLETWKNWEALFEYAHVAVAARAGEKLETSEAVAAFARSRTVACGALADVAVGRAAFFDMTPHLASSSAIRGTIAREGRARALSRFERVLCPSTAAYISEHGLYGRA